MKHYPSVWVKMIDVHHNGAISPVWFIHTLPSVNNLYVHNILFRLPSGSNTILLQFHTFDGRGWISSRSGGNSCILTGILSHDGWYGRGGKIDSGDFRLCISSNDWKVSWCFRSLWIAYSLWKMIQSSLGSLCVDRLLLNMDRFTNPERAYFAWVSWSSSFLFTHLITPQKYRRGDYSWMS